MCVGRRVGLSGLLVGRLDGLIGFLDGTSEGDVTGGSEPLGIIVADGTIVGTTIGVADEGTTVGNDDVGVGVTIGEGLLGEEGTGVLTTGLEVDGASVIDDGAAGAIGWDGAGVTPGEGDGVPGIDTDGVSVLATGGEDPTGLFVGEAGLGVGAVVARARETAFNRKGE